jgi:hypothetical protein
MRSGAPALEPASTIASRRAASQEAIDAVRTSVSGFFACSRPTFGAHNETITIIQP